MPGNRTFVASFTNDWHRLREDSVLLGEKVIPVAVKQCDTFAAEHHSIVYHNLAVGLSWLHCCVNGKENRILEALSQFCIRVETITGDAAFCHILVLVRAATTHDPLAFAAATTSLRIFLDWKQKKLIECPSLDMELYTSRTRQTAMYVPTVASLKLSHCKIIVKSSTCMQFTISIRDAGLWLILLFI